jgi:hypothetical protein
MLFLIIVLLLIVSTAPAYAYVGPGLGLGVIGTLFGALAAILLAIAGVIWYPIKRLLKQRGAAKKRVPSTPNYPAEGHAGQH